MFGLGALPGSLVGHAAAAQRRRVLPARLPQGHLQGWSTRRLSRFLQPCDALREKATGSRWLKREQSDERCTKRACECAAVSAERDDYKQRTAALYGAAWVERKRCGMTGTHRENEQRRRSRAPSFVPVASDHTRTGAARLVALTHISLARSEVRAVCRKLRDISSAVRMTGLRARTWRYRAPIAARPKRPTPHDK